MAVVRPLRGIRFDTAHVDLGSALAPPYDVISDALRTELYGRDLRNIVRIDEGETYADDVTGSNDRYSRARQHLDAWLVLGLLTQDEAPALYVHDHTFTAEAGDRRTRRGLFVRVRALPWGESDVLPHEHTLRGPREDRLRLMRATRAQTSAPFLMWDRAPGLHAILDTAVEGARAETAETPGENGPEEHRLVVIDEPADIAAIVEALAGARLYVADGHHRFETAAAYAQERREAAPGTTAEDGSQWTLAYLCDAADPSLEVLPTHRVVRPAAGLPADGRALAAKLPDGWSAESRPSLQAALGEAAARRGELHAVALVAPDGVQLLTTPRRTTAASPRDRLDVRVVQDDILGTALGISPEQITAGALGYARHAADAEAEVHAGTAAFALCLVGCTTAEIIDVSDAGEQMPQKSTYFHPKVPTGLVLAPL